MSAIPVIDIVDLFDPDVDKRRAVATKIDTACREIGFFQVVGHGVDPNLITQTYDVARRFFDLPLAEKRAVAQPTPDTVRGYCAVGEEAFAYNEDTTAPGDLHEKFDVGPIDVPDDPYFSPANAGRHFTPNQWPARPAGMSEIWSRYFASMNELSRTLMRAFALGLGLPENWFDDTMDRDISMLRAIHYPHQQEPPAPRQMRAAAHSDYGSVTIVRQEEAPGGLQVFTKDGDWVPVPVVPGALVVNLGDLMQQWTNDAYSSTRHRVTNPPRDVVADTRRMSLVFFHQPNYDAVIDCIPTCLRPGESPKYSAVTSGDHLLTKFERTHARV